MSSKTCQYCGGADIDRDPARGDAVCTTCGAVLEDNIIVSEVQFEENAYGGSSAIGQFVSTDNQGGTGFTAGYRGGGGKESREITLRKARDRISALAHQLRLNQHCIDTACNFYKMALSRHLTHGRKNPHVVAACVYITCRTEGTPHLLIDIADVMDIDVYRLGHTFMQLSKTLCINIPSVDPCVYVLRFANRMEFGEKTHDVSMTALRLVQRMKRDWIHTGRRPSGLCGAALLIAARMHGFNRSIMDVIKEVKVHENTVRKRLLEFGETPTSLLTLEEFMTVDLEEEQDPPAFRNSRKKDREKLQKLAEGDSQVEEELVELEKEIERQLQERQAKIRGPWAKYAKETCSEKNETTEESVPKNKEDEVVESFIAEQTLDAIQQCLREQSDGTEMTGLGSNICRSTTDESILMPPPDSTYLQLRHHLRPSMASLGIEEVTAVEIEERGDGEEKCEEQEELDLTGIDDNEIDTYLLTDNEAKLKTSMWMKLNGEFLQELEEKRKRKAEEEEEKQKKAEKKKRRTCHRKPKQPINASTPAEAIEKMLQEKRISTKINYEVLKNLKNISIPSLGATTNEEASKPIPVVIESDKGPSATSKRIKPVIGTRSRTTKVEKEETKVQEKLPKPVSETTVVHEEEEEEEEEEKEEEETELSAAKLLSQFHGEDDIYGHDEDYY